MPITSVPFIVARPTETKVPSRRFRSVSDRGVKRRTAVNIDSPSTRKVKTANNRTKTSRRNSAVPRAPSARPCATNEPALAVIWLILAMISSWYGNSRWMSGSSASFVRSSPVGPTCSVIQRPAASLTGRLPSA